jgi:23S rRNA pseudouridine2605 synthase
MTVPLNRAMSKLGILSRTQATDAIRAGRVKVDGRVMLDPAAPVVPERARITVDGKPRGKPPWRTILFHKPRGVVTTRRDPEGRPTIYDVIGEPAQGLVPVGRLDLATTGLLILTSDTRLADWITDPANAIPRTYVVTVRGRVTEEAAAMLGAPERGAPQSTQIGGASQSTRISGAAQSAPTSSAPHRALKGRAPFGASGSATPHTRVTVRKASARETHLVVELRQGRNREVRRLFESIGHEVTRLKRVGFGGLDLGALPPGAWRELTLNEVETAFGRRI